MRHGKITYELNGYNPNCGRMSREMSVLMHEKVLVVEDDRDISTIVMDCLSAEGYECHASYAGNDALREFGAQPYDLVICDLMLPGCPGERVVSAIRSRDSTIPILIISARGSTSDKVDLLSLGADDYLAKPFDIAELIARVGVQLRHTRHEDSEKIGRSRVSVGRWVLDRDCRTLEIDKVSLSLTCIEFNLVEALVSHPKRVFTRPELFEIAWGERFSNDAGTVNVHISNIRTKLRPTGTDSYIDTVWGVGFRLVVPQDDGEIPA